MSNSPRLKRGPVSSALTALFSLVVGGVVAAISYSLYQWETFTSTESLVRAASLGAFLMLTLLCLLAVIWALFAPQWIERLVQTVFSAVLVSVVLLLAVTALFFYFRVTR